MPKIRIRATQQVSYDQNIELNEADFQDLIRTSGRNMESDAMSPLGDLLDLRDCDGGYFDDIEIEEVDGQKRFWNPDE